MARTDYSCAKHQQQAQGRRNKAESNEPEHNETEHSTTAQPTNVGSAD